MIKQVFSMRQNVKQITGFKPEVENIVKVLGRIDEDQNQNIW